MRIVLTILLISYFFSNTFAQIRTDKLEEGDTSTYVVIIPFEDKMYLSDVEIDIDLAKHNNANVGYFKTMLQERIVKELAYELRTRANVLTFEYLPQKKNPDLEAFQSAVSYRVEKLEVLKVSDARGFKKIHKIDNDKSVKEMAYVTEANIREVEVFRELADKYRAEYVLYINQLEIRKAVDASQDKIQKNDYNREATIHYTIFSNSGKKINSGITFSAFPVHEKEISIIFGQYMLDAYKQIAEELPFLLSKN